MRLKPLHTLEYNFFVLFLWHNQSDHYFSVSFNGSSSMPCPLKWGSLKTLFSFSLYSPIWWSHQFPMVPDSKQMIPISIYLALVFFLNFGPISPIAYWTYYTKCPTGFTNSTCSKQNSLSFPINPHFFQTFLLLSRAPPPFLVLSFTSLVSSLTPHSNLPHIKLAAKFWHFLLHKSSQNTVF